MLQDSCCEHQGLPGKRQTWCYLVFLGDVGRVRGGAHGAAGAQPAVPRELALSPFLSMDVPAQTVAELPRATQHSEVVVSGLQPPSFF